MTDPTKPASTATWCPTCGTPAVACEQRDPRTRPRGMTDDLTPDERMVAQGIAAIADNLSALRDGFARLGTLAATRGELTAARAHVRVAEAENARMGGLVARVMEKAGLPAVPESEAALLATITGWRNESDLSYHRKLQVESYEADLREERAATEHLREFIGQVAALVGTSFSAESAPSLLGAITRWKHEAAISIDRAAENARLAAALERQREVYRRAMADAGERLRSLLPEVAEIGSKTHHLAAWLRGILGDMVAVAESPAALPEE